MRTSRDIEKILMEVTQEGFSVFAWSSLNGVIEKCEMKIKAVRKEYAEVELEIIASETKNVSDVVSGNRELNFYIPESSISFQGKLKKTIDNKKLKIVIPEECEFFERRKHERVSLNKSFASFEINKMMVKKPLHDISIGGFAIVIPKTDRLPIKKGLVIENCLLEFEMFKMKIKVECVLAITFDRFKLENLPYGGHKLSFRFLEISKKDREVLVEAVTCAALANKKLKGAS